MSRSSQIEYTPLVSSKKSGPHLVTISNVAKLRDNLGEVKLYKGNFGVVVTFSNEEITHQELYWLHGYNYSKLLKMLQLIGSGGDVLDSKEVVGKKLWIVIKHHVTIVDEVEVKREVEMFDFSAEDKVPNYPSLLEEYDVAAPIEDNEFPEPNF
jgi:hypothetical protein